MNAHSFRRQKADCFFTFGKLGTWAVFAAICVTSFLLSIQKAQAGPYLHTAIEFSKARSQGECENMAGKALAKMSQEGLVKVNGRLGWSSQTTIYVECIFVGQNARRKNQWIYYVSASSTDQNNSKMLRSRLTKSLRRLQPID